MTKYRIVKETGSKRYYVEIEKRKFFGGKQWKPCYQHFMHGGKIVRRFISLEKAKEWVMSQQKEPTKKQYYYI